MNKCPCGKEIPTDLHICEECISEPRKGKKNKVSLRLYDEEKELLIERFGSLQKGIDALIKKLKGEK